MLDAFLIKKSKKFTTKLIKYIASTGLTPNIATVLGLIFGMISVAFITVAWYKLAIVFLFLNRLFDLLDGNLARYLKTNSDRGAFFDIVFDFIFYGSFPLAFTVQNHEFQTIVMFVLYGMLLNGSSFLTFAILSPKHTENKHYKEKGFFYSIGLIEASETTLYFLLLLLFTRHFIIISIIYTILLLSSFILRCIYFFKITTTS